MTETAIVPLSETRELGVILAKSGFFQDAKGEAQAVVKVLAGRELGFGPVASMTGIYIVKGRVTLSANMIAAAIKRAPIYDYRVKSLTDKSCAIAFYQGGEAVGESSFSMDDAKQAKLGGDNWTKYPRNMLFARAISNGAKWYCPDIFGGPVYTPDELGALVDGETGDMLEGEIIDQPVGPGTELPPEPAEEPKPTNGDALRAFYDRVMEQIPYYDNIHHIRNTLKKLGYTAYNSEIEDELFSKLQEHAAAKADEEA